jgi:hypothetical protein
MKRFLIVGLLAFVGCELTESTPSEQVNDIFNDYSVRADFEATDSNWASVTKADGAFIIETNKAGLVNRLESRSGCMATNDNGCALVSCPSDLIEARFCSVKTWGIDSISFEYKGDTLKGRYFK